PRRWSISPSPWASSQDSSSAMTWTACIGSRSRSQAPQRQMSRAVDHRSPAAEIPSIRGSSASGWSTPEYGSTKYPRAAGDVRAQRIVERDPALVDQRHDRSGRERLRDRPDPVLRVRSRLASALRVGYSERQLEHPLTAHDNGGADARKTVLGLGCPDEPGQ